MVLLRHFDTLIAGAPLLGEQDRSVGFKRLNLCPLSDADKTPLLRSCRPDAAALKAMLGVSQPVIIFVPSSTSGEHFNSALLVLVRHP